MCATCLVMARLNLWEQAVTGVLCLKNSNLFQKRRITFRPFLLRRRKTFGEVSKYSSPETGLMKQRLDRNSLIEFLYQKQLLLPDALASGIFFFGQECYNERVGEEEKSYIHIGNSAELMGADRWLYRFFEILPGFLSWSTLMGMVLLSWQKPVWAAVFIIIFDLYWLIKTVFLSFHLRVNHRRLKEHMTTNWEAKIQKLVTSRALHTPQLRACGQPGLAPKESPTYGG